MNSPSGCHPFTYGEHEEPWGICTLINLNKCNPETIRCPKSIKQFIDELCKLIDMKKHGDANITYFGEDKKVAGYSFTQLIQTSLISGHFRDETNDAYIDIFSCKHYDSSLAANFTREYFFAKEFNYQIIHRT